MPLKYALLEEKDYNTLAMCRVINNSADGVVFLWAAMSSVLIIGHCRATKMPKLRVGQQL